MVRFVCGSPMIDKTFTLTVPCPTHPYDDRKDIESNDKKLSNFGAFELRVKMI